MSTKLSNLITPRLIFGVGFLVAAFATTTSILYFQRYLGLIPCTLCELQRVIVMALGIFFLIAFIHNPKRIGVHVYSVVLFIISILGLIIALHQVWLQTLPPDQAPTCGPGLNYLLTTLPFKDAVAAIFKGSAECFQVQWRLFNLSIAGWSAIFFAGVSIINFWQIFRKLPKYYSYFNTKK